MYLVLVTSQLLSALHVAVQGLHFPLLVMIAIMATLVPLHVRLWPTGFNPLLSTKLGTTLLCCQNAFLEPLNIILFLWYPK